MRIKGIEEFSRILDSLDDEGIIRISILPKIPDTERPNVFIREFEYDTGSCGMGVINYE